MTPEVFHIDTGKITDSGSIYISSCGNFEFCTKPWCTRWDEDNYNVTFECVMNKLQRDGLFNSTVPGAVGQVMNILGKPCYTPDTDLLTKDGWMNLKEYVEEQCEIPVATLNIQNNTVEYHKPTEYTNEQYKGNMFYQNSQSVNIMVTPHHKLWVKPINNKWGLYEAYKCPRHVEYSREFNVYDNEDIKLFKIPEYKNTYNTGRYYRKETVYKPEKEVQMDVWLEFLGWYISEGYTRRNTEISISQYKNIYPENCKRLEKCIIDMGYDIKYDNEKYLIYDCQLSNLLSKFGNSYSKYIPRYVYDCSLRQQKILLHSLMLGDWRLRNGKYSSYSTVSKKLADDVQELGMNCGYNTTLSYSKQQNLYDVYFSNKNYCTPQVNNKKDNRTYVPYSGNIYCVNVPNHIFMVRRKGKPVWCGNTYWDLTYESSNTLLLQPLSGYGISSVRKSRLVGVKSLTDTFLNRDVFICKVEGIRLDIE